MNRWKALAIAAAITGVVMSENAAAQVLGAKLGPTFSKMSVEDDDTDQSNLTSFGGGGFLRFGMGGMSFQVELLALTKGSKVEDIETDDDDIKLKLNYIEVPLLVRVGIGSGGNFAPYVMAGPAVAFDIGCEAEATFGGTSLEADCDDADVDGFDREKIDVGLTGVFGFEFPAGPGNLLLEGRYTYGLVNISKGEQSVKNRSIAVFAGYAVPLGGR